MLRLTAAAGAAALIIGTLASAAEAGTITLGRQPGAEGNRSGAFRTFSQERDRFVAPGTRFNHVVAKQRGRRGRAKGEFLRSQAWNGSVSNYDYTLGSGRSAGGTSLQEAVWFLEHELGSTRLNQLAGQAQTWVAEADGAVDVGGSWHRLGDGGGGTPILDAPPSMEHPGNGAGHGNNGGIVMVPLPPAALAGLSMLAGLGAARLRRFRAKRKMAESV